MFDCSEGSGGDACPAAVALFREGGQRARIHLIMILSSRQSSKRIAANGQNLRHLVEDVLPGILQRGFAVKDAP
jgi:hypothetical protein